MSGEEEHLSREELVEREYQVKRRDYEEWPKRLEEMLSSMFVSAQYALQMLNGQDRYPQFWNAGCLSD